MKRRILRVFLFLLLGAMINVAVAWTIALNLPGMKSPIVRDRKDPGADFELKFPPYTDRTSAYLMEQGYFGMPARGMTCCYYDQGKVLHGYRLNNMNGQHSSRVYALPLMPLWPGFAINTIFYAAILWLLFAFPCALRHFRGRRRIKRGLCVRCGYPVGLSQVCSECGRAVTHSEQ